MTAEYKPFDTLYKIYPERTKSSTLDPPACEVIFSCTCAQKTQQNSVSIFLGSKDSNFPHSPANSRKYLRKGGHIYSCNGIEYGAKAEIMEVKK